jgi:hypothetical protein
MYKLHTFMEDFVLVAFKKEITFMSDMSYYNHQTITDQIWCCQIINEDSLSHNLCIGILALPFITTYLMSHIC